jgi:hypothetical protein
MKPAILAIDNDPIVLYALRGLFQGEDIEIDTASSGLTGVLLFRKIQKSIR